MKRNRKLDWKNATKAQRDRALKALGLIRDNPKPARESSDCKASARRQMERSANG